MPPVVTVGALGESVLTFNLCSGSRHAEPRWFGHILAALRAEKQLWSSFPPSGSACCLNVQALSTLRLYSADAADRMTKSASAEEYESHPEANYSLGKVRPAVHDE